MCKLANKKGGSSSEHVLCFFLICISPSLSSEVDDPLSRYQSSVTATSDLKCAEKMRLTLGMATSDALLFRKSASGHKLILAMPLFPSVAFVRHIILIHQFIERRSGTNDIKSTHGLVQTEYEYNCA